MSTPIYKVSDGSTITFKKRGPELYAILSTPSGQVINGPSRMGNTEVSAAREILLANNIIDPNSGEPLTYTVERSQDSSTENSKGNNFVYALPRTTMSETTDETALNIAKANKEILLQDNKALSQTLNSELPPDVRFTNFINSQKSTIKKRLIPFTIDLITPFAPQAIPLIVSNLGVNENSTLDSVKSNAQDKADAAKNTVNGAEETAKDKDALKTLATGTATGVATSFILGKITRDQLIGLVNCPSSAKIQSVIKQRESLVKQINGMYKITLGLTALLGLTDIVISTIKTAIQLAKANPYPATGIPPALPPLTSGIQTTIASFVAELENQIKVKNKTLTTITLAVGSFAVFLGIILKFLDMLDIILQYCAGDQNMDLEQINDEINALANPTVVATQNDNTNTYKGFTLGVKIDGKNESKYIRRYAVAQNKQGVDILRTESSFASDPAVLISQLKFIIDSNPSITAE
jgi:hypothetical protein